MKRSWLARDLQKISTACVFQWARPARGSQRDLVGAGRQGTKHSNLEEDHSKACTNRNTCLFH